MSSVATLQTTQEGRTYVTTEELAVMLHVSVNTLAIWRNRKEGPPYRKVGRRVLYILSDVQSYIDSLPVFCERQGDVAVG